MVVLTVIGGLLVLLCAACLWEARSGRPEWGRRPSGEALTPEQASTLAKKQVATVLATAAGAATLGFGGDG